jgi:O-antigen/teichoic acid export membrane protein
MRIVQAMFVAGTSLVLGLYAVEHGLLLAQIVGLSMTVILFAGVFIYGNKLVGVGRLCEVARIHAKAPALLLPTALLDVFTLQLPYILIAMWFAAETTGQYRMAYSILGLPGALVGNAISQVFYKQFSAVWPDATAAKALLVKTWKVLALLGILPLLIVVLFGAELFSFVLGDVWREAGLMASMLAPMVFVSLIHSPTSVSFLPMGLESKMLYFGVSVLLYRPIALYIGYMQHSIYVGLAIFVVLEILQMLMFQYIAWQQLNFHINKGKLT